MNSGWEQLRDYLRRALFLPTEGSTFSVPVDELHIFVIATTMVAFVGLMIAANFFLLRYRRRGPGHRGVDVQGGALFEVLIISIPLAMFLLWFGLGYVEFVEMQSAPPDAMDVYVTAKQWMWKFDYPDGPNAIGVLTVPVGRPVKLLMTSRDVIHSFFVPAFRVKKDVLPGRYTQLWFQATSPGTYDILCTQYCGAGHSTMRGSVVVLPAVQFDAWLDAQRRGLAKRQDSGELVAAAPLVIEGQRVAAQRGCLKCHSVDGSPHIGPTWLGMYGRHEVMSDGLKVTVDEPYMTESMMEPNAKIVAGFSPVMPSFEGQLSAPETAALIEYIKSLRDPALEAQRSAEPLYEPRAR